MTHLTTKWRACFTVESLEGRTLFNALAPATLLGTPSLQHATRIDSRLLSAARAAGPGLSLTSAPLADGSLLTDGAGRIGVRITANAPNRLLPRLEAIGFKSVAVADQYHLIEGFLPPSAVLLTEPLSSFGMLGVTPIYAPQTAAGAVNSQGDFVLESDRVRASLPSGYNGSGVTVGILSDSYNRRGGASAGVSSGDLPANVNVLLEGPSGSTDEGRAMAEIVRDIAPAAGIAFASAFFGQAAFAQSIRDLANPVLGNAKVITDDVFYYEEPIFQDGVISRAIDDVAAQGVSYFSLAGNLGSNAYASSFRTASDAVFTNTFFDFDPGSDADTRQRLTLAPGQSVSINLQWDDPWYTTSGVDGDLNLFLLSGDSIVASSARNNLLTQEPSELLTYTNSSGSTQSLDLAITLDGGTAPSQIKWVNYAANGSAGAIVNEWATNSPTVIPHAAAAGAAAVGAVPYYDQTTVASYSSLGPATILFNNNGTRKATPEIRQAPDIVAVDGVDTTFFGSDSDGNGRPNFFGTSAAAPHAAAVAALLKQANPAMSPSQIYSRLQNTATDIGAPGVDAKTGHGLISAYRAIFGAPVPATTPIFDGFESGVLGKAWSTSSTGAGRKLVTAANAPVAGTRHLTLDSSLDGRNGLNEATLHLDAAAASGALVLTFDQKEFNDEDHPMPASFTGSGNYDGVAMSVDGVNWVRLVSLTGSASNNGYQSFRFDLSAAAAASGLTLSSNTRIRFQQYDNQVIGSDGMAFDNVRVAAGGVTVSPTSGLITGEDGTTATFTVVLDVAPSQNVTIPIDSSDSTEGTADKSSLTFTPADWDQPQTVTLTGQPDSEDDGDEPYTIVVGPATSADTAYAGVNPADVSVTNRSVAVSPPPTSPPPTSPPPTSPPPTSPPPTSPPPTSPPPTSPPPTSPPPTSPPPTSPPPTSPPPVSPPPVSPPPPAVFGAKVNFQPTTAATVAGYLVDGGAVYGSRDGQTYGWNFVHTDTVFDRNANANQLLDTHLQVKQSGRWELAVPNGQYDVTVGVGDASGASTNNVWIEGVNLYNYVPLATGSFLTRTLTVTVSDGRLLLGTGSQSGGQTRLNFIEVVETGTTSPPASPPPVSPPPPTSPPPTSPPPTSPPPTSPPPTSPPPTSPPPTSPPPVSPPPASPPPPPPAGISINFQPAAAPAVAGYLVDAGATYASRNGQIYGWTINNGDAVVDRELHQDQRLDTLVQVKPSSRWELALPSGTYTVVVGVGDAGAASQNNVWIEGVNVYNYQSLPAGGFLTRSVSATVSDGRLTLGIGSQSTGLTRINYIEVTGGPLSPPATTSPPTSPPPVSPPPVSPPPVSPPPVSPPPVSPPPVSPPPPGTVKVNFQPSGAGAVDGYLVDAGQTYASRNGESYGWNVDHSDALFDRQVNSDQRVDTVASVKQGGRWELGVANGTYKVTVTVGDAGKATSNNVWIEGVNLFNYVPLSANVFSTRTLTVNVSDGRLLLGVGSASTGMTGINSIEVTKG